MLISPDVFLNSCKSKLTWSEQCWKMKYLTFPPVPFPSRIPLPQNSVLALKKKQDSIQFPTRADRSGDPTIPKRINNKLETSCQTDTFLPTRVYIYLQLFTSCSNLKRSTRRRNWKKTLKRGRKMNITSLGANGNRRFGKRKMWDRPMAEET